MDINNLTPEQQALFASIMGNSPQPGAMASPLLNQQPTEQKSPPISMAGDPNRQLTQAEIDELIRSMT